MAINDAIFEDKYNHKLIIISALFLDYEYFRLQHPVYSKIKIENGMMYMNNIQTFKKLFFGFMK